MTPSLIRAASLTPRPWPNGLGITRDVAGSDGEGMGWLISIADLTGEAAFSYFPGVDRIFTLIEGAGATLTVDGIVLPCRPFVPSLFPGDRPTHYVPQGGPARAFNVFTAREAFEAQVFVQAISANHPAPSGGKTLAVHCAEGVLAIGDARLEAGDTLLHPGDAPIEAAGAAAIAIIVALRPANPRTSALPQE
ncbi:HutD/Ves family protein [Roseomonas sp. WA12]